MDVRVSVESTGPHSLVSILTWYKMLASMPKRLEDLLGLRVAVPVLRISMPVQLYISINHLISMILI